MKKVSKRSLGLSKETISSITEKTLALAAGGSVSNSHHMGAGPMPCFTAVCTVAFHPY